MKRTISIIVSLILICFCLFDAQMLVYAGSKKWDFQASYDTKAKFSVDKKQKSGNGKYSIKIRNIDYGVSRVEKTFKVKPNTRYKATVMAKCVNFKKSKKSRHDFGKFGAVLATAQRVPSGSSYTGNKWKKLTYYFNSGDAKKHTLALYNAGNKGTVYFSDFKLEELSQSSNEWNLCVVYLKSIKAPIVQDGKKQTLSKKLCQKDMDYCTDTINQLYSYMNLLSEGKMDIKSIDFYECDETVKTLTSNGKGAYSINNNDKVVREKLDAIIKNAEKNSGKRYDQIILVSPLPTDIAGKLGVNFQERNIIQVYINHLEFSSTLIATFIHELLHSVEYVSKQIDPEGTVSLHACEDEYSEYYHAWQNGLPGNCTWFSDCMRRTTPDGRGLNEKAFYTHANATLKVVYGSKKKVSYKKTDVGTLNISKVSDKTYTGKAIKPTVTVKNSKKKLKRGKDYTLSYACNTDIGIASIIIKGKGKYSGTVKQNFNIVPSQPTVSVVSSGDLYTLTWNATKFTDGYEIYGSEDGNTFSLLKTIDATATDTVINTEITSNGKQYIFKVRAYKKLYPQTFYSK